MLHWSSAEVDVRHRYDAWAHALNASHLPWALGRPRTEAFSAQVCSVETGALNIVNCRCDPCDGARTSRHIRASDDAHYGLLVVRRGRERVRQGSFAAELTPGSMLIWDSGEACEFDVLESLDKTTLFFSKDWLDRMIGRSELPTGVMDTSGGFGALFRSRILTLDGMLGSVDGVALDHLGRSLAEDIIYAVGNHAHRIVPPRAALVARVTAIMEAAFRNPKLSPGVIAARAGISVRYLHQLFQDADETVCARLLRLRLDAVAHDLRDPALANASLTQIGFANGFASSAHLSRSFRNRYGISPSQWRRDEC
ncbi:helix-turn-helix domain-containing protein [Halomonas sp. ANAO-440]|uniref:helix-turn-helix domain-containing protein n=1 Tax=Halomonas sp. ANAO-440 TaxID=2861360 RepID=UPI001CAA4A13|nr:helix-turn-helix domain-containing protein [Halomonas sp. ANAO-440]MBZ0331212.1 helix-turn-helix domain-containing protein [Halomonas sp. ANAO-440]